ncbi:MAG: adenosine-specific kinase [Candidatus Omnitrophica bacterium]|nr:adenosine-specific kinase [Candidatus Omnitrophota bacterium]MBU1047236.1 adenosine-specific kinase [Candidatus Omnitrophota bacterium]MBU1631212.1 adenosine-specific kinase [Candidatus Omnitrophota bacterium]MBU1889178.1 adenosine-specific kinase [Candidatus Omnitrophota bacterium]
MELKVVKIEGIPEGANIILGQAHFIKSVEDIYEAIVNINPFIKFGVAFCEASGKCLIRVEGNDEQLKEIASKNALKIGAGHCFIIVMKEGFPINILNALKNIPEVCSIYCATANSVEVILAETGQGRGVMGVIDGSSPKGIEDEAGIKWRKELLRKIGYKR